MKAIKVCRIILLVVLMACPIAHAAPLAILTDVSGSVQVVRGGKTSAGRNGTQLQASDVVCVAKGAATIYYATKAPQKIGTGQQVTVGASGDAAKPSPWKNVYAGLSQGFARRRTASATVRPGTVEFIAPAGKIGEMRPTFLWTLNQLDATAIADYVVTLKDAEGKTLWEKTTASFVLEYPQDATALEPGKKYVWSVAGRHEDEIFGLKEVKPEWVSLTATLEVASSDETSAAQSERKELAEALQNEPQSTQNLVLAAALAERGFTSEANTVLVPELTKQVIEQGNYLAQLDKLLPEMDEAEQTLLRSLFLQNGQLNFAAKITLPELSETTETETTAEVEAK
jgi:hypothetical protein